MAIADTTLNGIAEATRACAVSIMDLYDAIRAAKEAGYAYSELERATGFARGTLQNICDGQNPRFSLQKDFC